MILEAAGRVRLVLPSSSPPCAQGQWELIHLAIGPPAPCMPILQPAPGRQRVNDAQGAAGSLLLALSGTMGPLWEVRQVWADPRTGSYPAGLVVPASCSCQVLSLPPQVGGERVAALALPVGPGRTLASPTTRNTTSAWPVAMSSNLTPTNLSGYKMQSDSHGHKACQMTPSCNRPDCELVERCQHCQIHTWVSSRISCAFRICRGGCCRS